MSAVPEAGQLKTDFLANMSHELRSPLNVIIGFAKLMYRGRVGEVSEVQREYLGDILDSAEQLLTLINDLVDLARADAGRLDFHPEPLDLMLVLSEVQDSLNSLAQAKRIAVELSIAPACTNIELDPDRLRQVIHNALSNALKLAPEGGKIMLRALCDEQDRLRVEICDPARSEGASERELPEAALNLALTQRIVTQQGGHVGSVSHAGQGSTFYLVLPRKPQSSTSLEA